MKTVMKKMFCLMLVAVLMVGVMPFQAFADATIPAITIIVQVDGNNAAVIHSSAADASGTMQLSAWQAEAEAEVPYATFVEWTWHDLAPVSGSELIADQWEIIAHFTENKCGTCSKPVSDCDCCPTCHKAAMDCDCCGGCGVANGAAHTPGCPFAPPTTFTLTMELKIGESSNEIAATNSKSGLSGTIDLKSVAEELFPSYTYMWTSLGKSVTTMEITADTTLQVRMRAPVVTSTCSTCGETYTGSTHTCPPCSAVPGCVLTKGHGGNCQCACGKYPQKGSTHASNCSFYEAPTTTTTAGTHSLNVWAKLWVGETLNKTILLDTITGLSGNDVVAYVIGNNVSRLQSKFPSGYNNIEWTKAVYFNIDSKTTGTVDTKMKVAEEGNVFINLYSTEKLVVVRVHTGKTYNVDRSVQVGGFRVGETVTYNDVLKAVQKYYNVSSMKMYTYGEWEKVVNGGNGATTPNFIVKGGEYDNVYEVYLTGSAKTSTTASNKKADSTNPKTGDEIFVPMTVLFASVSSLAVLYYLNKKRAI